ncbi:MAG: hypothetical protein LIO91_09515 [Bacteroidales bacterium]|nr:hypothetical protein [Bacteroidales bacterium]
MNNKIIISETPKTVKHPVLGEVKVLEFEHKLYYRATPTANALGFPRPYIRKDEDLVYNMEERTLFGGADKTFFIRYVGIESVKRWLKIKHQREKDDLIWRHYDESSCVDSFHAFPIYNS